MMFLDDISKGIGSRSLRKTVLGFKTDKKLLNNLYLKGTTT